MSPILIPLIQNRRVAQDDTGRKINCTITFRAVHEIDNLISVEFREKVIVQRIICKMTNTRTREIEGLNFACTYTNLLKSKN